MGDFNTLIATLCYQKVLDVNGVQANSKPQKLTFDLTIKEYHVLVLIAAGYKSITDIYQALKYLRLFLSYSSIFVYIKRLENKGLIMIVTGQGKAFKAIYTAPTLAGYTKLQAIQTAILDAPKLIFRPAGSQGKPWKQKALRHLQFNANGYESDIDGRIKGVEYNETRGRKKQSKPPASESE